jgi:hypothetical protein
MLTYNAQKTDWFVGLAGQGNGAAASAPARASAEASRPRGVTRTLFVTLGQCAQTVAAEAARLSAHWMQTEPPLATLDANAWGGNGAAAGEPLAQTVAALHALAAEDVAAALQRQGCAIQRHDEIQVYLVADMTGDGGAGAASGASGAAGTPTTNPAAEMLAALRSVEAQVRQELRARTASHVLLLARPADQAKVAACVKTLHVGGVADVWLTGAVTAEHQRLDDAVWLQRAGRALATLAWAAFPSHAYTDSSGGGDGVRVLGVAGWDTALPAVRHWLALRSAAEAVRLLHAEGVDGGRVAENAAAVQPSLLTESMDGLLQSLASAAAPPLPQQAWAADTADWAQMAELVGRVTAADKQLDNRHQVRVRQTRFAWLEVQMNEWAAWVSAQTRQGLAPAAGLPQLAAHQERLTQAAAQLAVRTEAIAALAEDAEGAVEQAAAAVQAAEQRVAEAAGVFPPYSLKGLTALLLQPWRWPVWAWCYAFALPNRCAELLAALAGQRRAVWHESNVHTLRQMLYTAQQDLQHLTAQLAAVETAVNATADALAQGAAHERAGAAPWTDTTLEALWTMQEAEAVAERCRHYLTRRPLAQWPPDGVAEDLTAAMAAPEAPLADWTALDCLVEGLAYAEQMQRSSFESLLRSALPQEPFAWLDTVCAASVPLWPRPALAQGKAEQCWLLAPPAGGQRAGAGGEAAHGLAKLHWWAETQREPVDVCWLAGDAVILLRWMQLTVKDLEAEM